MAKTLSQRVKELEKRVGGVEALVSAHQEDVVLSSTEVAEFRERLKKLELILANHAEYLLVQQGELRTIIRGQEQTNGRLTTLETGQKQILSLLAEIQHKLGD